MNYHWTTDARTPRQHWLHAGSIKGIARVIGLVYEVQPDAFSVYGEDYSRNPFARVFLGVYPTIDEAKDMLVTITASQQL